MAPLDGSAQGRRNRPDSPEASPGSPLSRTTPTNAWMGPDGKGTIDEARASRWTAGKMPREEKSVKPQGKPTKQKTEEKKKLSLSSFVSKRRTDTDSQDGSDFLSSTTLTADQEIALEEWLDPPTPRTNPQAPLAGKLSEYMKTPARVGMSCPPQSKRVREDCIQYFTACKMEAPKQRHYTSTSSANKSANVSKELDARRGAESDFADSPRAGSASGTEMSLASRMSRMSSRRSTRRTSTKSIADNSKKAAFSMEALQGPREKSELEVNLNAKAFRFNRLDSLFNTSLKTDEDLCDLTQNHGTCSRSLHATSGADPAATSKTLHSLTQLLRRQLNPEEPSKEKDPKLRRQKSNRKVDEETDGGDTARARSNSLSKVAVPMVQPTGEPIWPRGRSSSMCSLHRPTQAWQDTSLSRPSTRGSNGIGGRGSSGARQLLKLAKQAAMADPDKLQRLADLAQVSMATVTKRVFR